MLPCSTGWRWSTSSGWRATTCCRCFARSDTALPAHWTSSGKVLLASLPLDELDRRLQTWQPEPVTRHTITNRDALLAELERVRERGWAQNVEEGHLGVVSVGAPIRGADRSVLAAVSVVGAAGRLQGPMLHRCTRMVLEAAEVISRRLGYRRPMPARS